MTTAPGTTGQFDASAHPRETDGKFAVKPHAEANLAEIDLTAAPAGLDAEALSDALGEDYETLTADQKRLVGVLLDPAINRDLGYDTDPEVLLDEFDSYGGDDLYDATQIADRVALQYEDVSYALETSYPDSSDFSYVVSQWCGHDIGYLSLHGDTKYLNADRHVDSDATGLRKALAIAEQVDADMQTIRARALKAGLIAGPTAAQQQSGDALQARLDNLFDAYSEEQHSDECGFGACTRCVVDEFKQATGR